MGKTKDVRRKTLTIKGMWFGVWGKRFGFFLTLTLT